MFRQTIKSSWSSDYDKINFVFSTLNEKNRRDFPDHFALPCHKQISGVRLLIHKCCILFTCIVFPTTAAFFHSSESKRIYSHRLCCKVITTVCISNCHVCLSSEAFKSRALSLTSLQHLWSYHTSTYIKKWSDHIMAQQRHIL